MPDQQSVFPATPAERRSMKRLTAICNDRSRPRYWRDETGTLRARGGRYLYVFNAAEGRWNDAGKVLDGPFTRS